MGKPKAGTLHDSPRFPSVLSSEHLLCAAAISPLHSLAAPVLMPPTQVAVELLKAVVSSGAPLTDVASVVKLFEMIVPLLKDNTDPNAAAEPQEDPNAEPSYPAGDAAAALRSFSPTINGQSSAAKLVCRRGGRMSWLQQNQKWRRVSSQRRRLDLTTLTSA